jgi:hypothetical protein
MGYVDAYLCEWFDASTLVLMSAFSHPKLLRSNRELLEKSRDALAILLVSGRSIIVTLPMGRELSALTKGVMYVVLQTNGFCWTKTQSKHCQLMLSMERLPLFLALE